MNIRAKTTLVCKTFGVSLLTILLLLPATGTSAIYKWVDENGKTHYGSKRPETAKVEKLKIEVKEPVIEKKDPEDGKKDNNKTKAQKPQYELEKISAKEKSRLCNQAKSDVIRIEARGRMRERDAEGNVRYLSEKERNQRISAAKRRVKQNC